LDSFWINYGVTQHIKPGHVQWLIPFAVQLIPGGIFLAGIPFFVRESPRWLVTRNRRDEAIKNLCFIRGLDPEDPYIINEVNEIDVQVEHDRTAVGTGFFAPFRQLFGKGFLFRRMLITTSLFMWQNGTGINAVNYYSPTIFKVRLLPLLLSLESIFSLSSSFLCSLPLSFPPFSPFSRPPLPSPQSIRLRTVELTRFLPPCSPSVSPEPRLPSSRPVSSVSSRPSSPSFGASSSLTATVVAASFVLLPPPFLLARN
jgi:hypothetical protein